MLYRHFKGGLYWVHTMAARLEADGTAGELQVVYQSVTTGQVWVRPRAEFVAEVAPGVPRFAPVGEEVPDGR